MNKYFNDIYDECKRIIDDTIKRVGYIDKDVQKINLVIENIDNDKKEKLQKLISLYSQTYKYIIQATTRIVNLNTKTAQIFGYCVNVISDQIVKINNTIK